LPVVSRDVVGHGLGSAGTATKLSAQDAASDDITDFDGGALEILYLYGIGVGLVLLVTLVMAVIRAWRRSRGTQDITRAAGAALCGLLIQLLFGNTLAGVAGVFFWLLLGTLSRDEEQEVAPA
jgi:hypothetical protein